MVNLLVSGYPGDAETNPATERSDAVVSTTDCKAETPLSRDERKFGAI